MNRLLAPLLYMVCKFSLLTIALGLFIGDFWISAGIVSAVALYYILDSKQKQETSDSYMRLVQEMLAKEMENNVKPDETERL